MKTLGHSIGIVVVATVLMSSGTYRPPKLPKGMKLDKAAIKAGQALFEKTPFAGKGGHTCASCHSKKRSQPFRRGSLKKRKTKLFAQVSTCVTHKNRVAGKKLEGGSKEAFQLGAYLVSRYRLPYTQLTPFTVEAAKDASGK